MITTIILGASGPSVIVGDEDGEAGDKGSKDVVHIYSSLLLISSNNTSFSIPCV